MRKVRLGVFRTGLFLFVSMLVISCSKEDLDELSDTFYVRHKGSDMPAHIYGNGSEKVFLIMLHGGPGGTGLTYRVGTIKSKIEKNCAVVYFDQRGAGNSQGQFPKEDFNVDIMAEDVLALVKVIQTKYGSDSRFFLMGHSWGGALGPATLLKNQDVFEGWIDVDGAHDPRSMYFEYINNFERVSAEQIELGNSVGYWEAVIDEINAIDPTIYSEDDFLSMNRQAFEAEYRLRKDGLIYFNEDISGELTTSALFRDHPLTALANNAISSSVLVRGVEIFDKLSYSDRLNEITIPSLVLWGRYDMVVPPFYAQDAIDNLGSVSKELVIFENSGHSPMFEEPDQFAREVIEFINQNK